MDNVPGHIPGQNRDPFPGNDTDDETPGENMYSSGILSQRIRRRRFLREDSGDTDSTPTEVSTANISTIQI